MEAREAEAGGGTGRGAPRGGGSGEAGSAHRAGGVGERGGGPRPTGPAVPAVPARGPPARPGPELRQLRRPPPGAPPRAHHRPPFCSPPLCSPAEGNGSLRRRWRHVSLITFAGCRSRTEQAAAEGELGRGGAAGGRGGGGEREMAGPGGELERLGGGDEAPKRAFEGRDVSGVEVLIRRCGPGQKSLECPTRPGRLGVFLVAEGVGYLRVGAAGEAFHAGEPAVLVPPADYDSVHLQVDGEGSFLVLELSLELDEEDIAELAEQAGRGVIFRRHSECPTYQQSFKSAQTVSRFLLPPGKKDAPRLCIGSVQTTGPDEVGRHKHPMLDQMFLGLPGCKGKVWADGETTDLHGLDLLHIPLGSTHGASVGEGEKLGYIWIDRYIDRELCKKWFARDHEEGDGKEDELPAVEYPTSDRVIVAPSKEDLGGRAAAFVASCIRAEVDHKGSSRVIVATGASQFEFLAALVAIDNMPWDRVSFFHLDEYCGLDDQHPASFRRYLRERLFSQLRPQPKAVHLVNPDDIQGYSALLAEGPIDLACIGVGENGHIAFNDPPVADFDDPELVKVVELDEACRMQQVGEGWFPTLTETPSHAVTLTVPAIMRARVISCVVPDERKADAIRGMLCGDISTKCPASVLRRHRRAVLWLDEGSASRVPNKEYLSLPSRKTPKN